MAQRRRRLTAGQYVWLLYDQDLWLEVLACTLMPNSGSVTCAPTHASCARQAAWVSLEICGKEEVSMTEVCGMGGLAVTMLVDRELLGYEGQV